MSTPVTKMPKPDAAQYENVRKLFLVPVFLLPPNTPEEGQRLLELYWTEVRDHIYNLERSLTKVSHVYHEVVYVDGEDGLKILDQLNPQGSSFIQALCHSEACLEATEDRASVEESSDWQRCLSLGLVSEKVVSTALDGYQEATKLRFEHIGKRIDETLKEGESGVLFIREDHRVQFPSDVRVFYVAPPSLDAIKRWIGDQVRAAAGKVDEATQTAESDEADQSE